MCRDCSLTGFLGDRGAEHPQSFAGLFLHRLHTSNAAESVTGCLQAHMLSDLPEGWWISPAQHCLGFELWSRGHDIALLCTA